MHLFSIPKILRGNVQGLHSFSLDTYVNLHAARRGVQQQPENDQLVVDSFAVPDVAEDHSLRMCTILDSDTAPETLGCYRCCETA